jgi:peroxiredoxin
VERAVPEGVNLQVQAGQAVALAAAAIVAALLAWACYRLLVDRGRLLLRLEVVEARDGQPSRARPGLPDGAFLTDFALPALAGANTGAIVTLSSLSGQPLLLVFLRPGCLYSRALAWEVTRGETEPDAPRLVAILTGEIEPEDDLGPFAALPGLVLLDSHGQVASLMRVSATPSGYLVRDGRRTDGSRIAGPVTLLAAARGEAASDTEAAPLSLTPLPDQPTPTREPLPVGSVAPGFTLPMLAGGEWSLADRLGEPVTLLFADPDCPPCWELLEVLAVQVADDLVIVSRRNPDENRHLVEEFGIAAPVLLQTQREVARQFRVLDTPAAYRIDASGRIEAGPAIGKDAVLRLLSRDNSGTMGGG